MLTTRSSRFPGLRQPVLERHSFEGDRPEPLLRFAPAQPWGLAAKFGLELIQQPARLQGAPASDIQVAVTLT